MFVTSERFWKLWLVAQSKKNVRVTSHCLFFFDQKQDPFKASEIEGSQCLDCKEKCRGLSAHPWRLVLKLGFVQFSECWSNIKIRQCTCQFSCFNILNICLLIAVSRGNVLFGLPRAVAKD